MHRVLLSHENPEQTMCIIIPQMYANKEYKLIAKARTTHIEIQKKESTLDDEREENEIAYYLCYYFQFILNMESKYCICSD